MPHTSRRKSRQPAKRIEVVDDEGWTRITTNKAPRAPRSQRDSHAALAATQVPAVALPEKDASVTKIKARYDEIEQQWLESDACKILSTVLRDRALQDGLQVDCSIVFGTGSFCGLRNGWILRDGPPLCQLAVFRTMQQVIGEASGKTLVAYAQDPAYNNIDVDFLKSMNIAVIESPAGFALLTEKSLAYTPCAELDVELHVLKGQPAILLSSKLDWSWRNEKGQACSSRVGRDRRNSPQEETDNSETPYNQPDPEDFQRGFDLERECRIVEDFKKAREGSRIPDFRDAAFRDQHLYWSSLSDGGLQKESGDDKVK